MNLAWQARLYVIGVIVAGGTVTFTSAAQIYMGDLSAQWLVLAALTLLTGSFTIKVPSLSARISVSDAFVVASVLLFGPSVATVIVAIDCLVMTFWMQPGNRTTFRSLFNLSAVSLSIWTASHLFYLLADANPGDPLVLSKLLWPLFILATTYFFVNSGLVAVALGFERRTSAVRLWIDNFPWLSLNYFGGVSVAALLVSYTRSVDLTAVSIILPLLVISYLTYKTSLGRVEDAQRHVDQVNSLYLSTIETLAMAVDAKDQITHGHIRRVQVYAVELAKRLGVTESRQLKAIEVAALLHDMGKLAIPEHILNKPGKLSSAEFDKMKRHADIGADLLSSIRFPYPVVPIVRHHHEHWDGRGYPGGISGTDIPLGARILSVVDCFDALNSDRPYRPKLAPEDAFEILRQRRGLMYDPLVVDTFIAAYNEISPAAIQAGEEAKSLIDSADLHSLGHPGASLDDIRSGASESTLLARCREAILKTPSAKAAMEVATQCLRQLTPATVYCLYRYESISDTLVCTDTTGDERNLLKGLTVEIGERVTGWCAATHQAAVNSDASLDLIKIANEFSPSLRSTISIPLLHQNSLLGVLTAYSTRENSFDASHCYQFEQIGSALRDHFVLALTKSGPVVNFRGLRAI